MKTNTKPTTNNANLRFAKLNSELQLSELSYSIKKIGQDAAASNTLDFYIRNIKANLLIPNKKSPEKYSVTIQAKSKKTSISHLKIWMDEIKKRIDYQIANITTEDIKLIIHIDYANKRS